MQSDQIDDIICAKIPDPETDANLHDVVITNMIHGPCGTINPQSSCMVDNKSTKRYRRCLSTGSVDHHRLRSSEDGDRKITVKVKGNYLVVDNFWIVPYSPLLSKTSRLVVTWSIAVVVLERHNYKFVTKESNMAAFGLQVPNPND